MDPPPPPQGLPWASASGDIATTGKATNRTEERVNALLERVCLNDPLKRPFIML
jgi:hypothetical protein